MRDSDRAAALRLVRSLLARVARSKNTGAPGCLALGSPAGLAGGSRAPMPGGASAWPLACPCYRPHPDASAPPPPPPGAVCLVVPGGAVLLWDVALPSQLPASTCPPPLVNTAEPMHCRTLQQAARAASRVLRFVTCGCMPCDVSPAGPVHVQSPAGWRCGWSCAASRSTGSHRCL